MNVAVLNNFEMKLTLIKECVAHSNRNSIFKVKVILRGQRPKKVQSLPVRTLTVLYKALFSNSLGKVFIMMK